MTVVVGIAMVKDEADIIEGTVRHMAGEVDVLVVADNNSTDQTVDILEELALELPLLLLHDLDPAYRQSAKMSALAERAAADVDDPDTWIVPFDADELWTVPGPVGRIRDILAAPPGGRVVVAELLNHFRTGLDVDDPDPFRSMVWSTPWPQPLTKVAFCWEPGAVIHQGNHGVTLPSPASIAVPRLAVHHYPVRSAAQLIRKARNGAAAYAAAPELPEDMGEHWRSWGQMSDADLTAAYEAWWHYPDPARKGPGGRPLDASDRGLVLNPAPYRRWE